MKIPSREQRRAFTLIEIMVSIVIFALIVAAVYSTWVLILKSSQVGQSAAARAQRQRIVVRTIEDSLTCIQSVQASMQYYYFTVTNGDEPSLSFVSRVPDIFPRNGKFGDFNLRRLTFAVEPDANSVKNLVLRQNPILMDMDSDEQSTPLILARDVKDFMVECWDTNAMDWDKEWDDTNSIPPMVRVTLTLNGVTDQDGNNSTLTVTREIAMPSETLPVVEQIGRLGGGGFNGINIGANTNVTPGVGQTESPISIQPYPNHPNRNSGSGDFPSGSPGIMPPPIMPPQQNIPGGNQ